MGNFLQLIVGSVTFLKQNWPQIVAAYVALVAAATMFIKAAQAFADLFPNHQAADTIFGAILRFLLNLSHTRALNALALSPRPAHAFMIGKVSTKATAMKAATGFVRLATLLFLTIAIAACAAFQGLVQQTISCDSQNVVAAIPTVLSLVIDIIQGGDDWNSKLTTLGEQQGVELVACALQKAIGLLGSNSAIIATQAKVPNSVAIARATAWITTHTK